MDTLAALRALSLATERFRHAVAAHFQLSVSDTVAMSQLSASAGALTPGHLADQLGLTPGSITALLDRLERAGMTERRAHPSDRRKITVHLTDRGHRALATVQGWMRDALRGLDEASLAQMTTVLTEVAIRLDRQADAITPDRTRDGGDPSALS